MVQDHLCSHIGELIHFFGLPNNYFIHLVSVPQLRHKLQEQYDLVPNIKVYLNPIPSNRLFLNV